VLRLLRTNLEAEGYKVRSASTAGVARVAVVASTAGAMTVGLAATM